MNVRRIPIAQAFAVALAAGGGFVNNSMLEHDHSSKYLPHQGAKEIARRQRQAARRAAKRGETP